MSRRNKSHSRKYNHNTRTPAPRADYDCVTTSGKRRSPKTAIKSEDDILTESKRKKLVATAQDIPRNFELAAWAIRMHLDYISQFSIQYTTPDDGFNEALEYNIKQWSRPGNFDTHARHSFQRMVRLAESCALLDGDFGYLLLADGTVQGIEGDRIATPTYSRNAPRDVTFKHGMELDSSGRIRRLSICNRNGSMLEFEKLVAAANVVLRGYYTRIDQLRGISPLAPAINRLLDLYENYDLALAKAKLANMLGLKLTREKLDRAPDFGTVDADTEEEADETTNKYKIPLSGSAPFYLEMSKGEDLSFLESKIPSTEFANFCEQMIRMALMSLDIPYEFFDGSGVTYSLIRQKTMQYYQSATAKRKDVAASVSSIMQWHVMREVAAGRIKLKKSQRLDDLTHEIIFTGLPWLDPLKEVKANREAVAADFTSEIRVCREHGVDLNDILREKARAKELRERYGLTAEEAVIDIESDKEAAQTTEEAA